MEKQKGGMHPPDPPWYLQHVNINKYFMWLRC